MDYIIEIIIINKHEKSSRKCNQVERYHVNYLKKTKVKIVLVGYLKGNVYVFFCLIKKKQNKIIIS